VPRRAPCAAAPTRQWPRATPGRSSPSPPAEAAPLRQALHALVPAVPARVGRPRVVRHGPGHAHRPGLHVPVRLQGELRVPRPDSRHAGVTAELHFPVLTRRHGRGGGLPGLLQGLQLRHRVPVQHEEPVSHTVGVLLHPLQQLPKCHRFRVGHTPEKVRASCPALIGMSLTLRWKEPARPPCVSGSHAGCPGIPPGRPAVTAYT
jgi:hypothetical protein